MEKPDDYLVSDFDIKTLIAILSLGRTGHFKVHSPGAKKCIHPDAKVKEALPAMQHPELLFFTLSRSLAAFH